MDDDISAFIDLHEARQEGGGDLQEHAPEIAAMFDVGFDRYLNDPSFDINAFHDYLGEIVQDFGLQGIDHPQGYFSEELKNNLLERAMGEGMSPEAFEAFTGIVMGAPAEEPEPLSPGPTGVDIGRGLKM